MNIDLKMNLFLAPKGLWNSGKLSEVQRLLIESCLIRGDERQANIFLSDWNLGDTLHIFKWVPGDHYYVGPVKFDTYEEAARHIREQGCAVGNVRYRYISVE